MPSRRVREALLSAQRASRQRAAREEETATTAIPTQQEVAETQIPQNIIPTEEIGAQIANNTHFTTNIAEVELDTILGTAIDQVVNPEPTVIATDVAAEEPGIRMVPTDDFDRLIRTHVTTFGDTTWTTTNHIRPRPMHTGRAEVRLNTSEVINEAEETIMGPDIKGVLPWSYFEKLYKKNYYTENVIFEERIIEKEPSVENPDEEALINYVELADTLATMKADTVFNREEVEAEWLEEYERFYMEYKELILRHKRKVNA